MPSCKNLVGKTFNYLTVIQKTDKRKNGAVLWLCQCKCGNLKEVTSADLNAGRVTSCGCYKREQAASKYINLLGKRFGRLTVIEKTDKRTKNRSVIWKCQCDCGTICEMSSDSLNSGTQSCGCLQKELAKQAGINRGYDLTGKRFGKLVVLSKIEQAEQRTWLCQCDCGNQCIVESKYLLRGHKLSCGCLSTSAGEYAIAHILTKNNIPFITQYHNHTCKFLDTNYFAYFDFFVNNQYIIEYDGIQHFKPSRFNNISDQKAQNNFIITQQHDEYKNKWCKENNIPLIRIPYTHLSKITIKDLLLETTTFLQE